MLTCITGGQEAKISALELKNPSPRSGSKSGTGAGSQLEMHKLVGTLVSRMEALEQMDSRSAGTQLLDDFDLLKGRLQILEAQVCVEYLTLF